MRARCVLIVLLNCLYADSPGERARPILSTKTCALSELSDRGRTPGAPKRDSGLVRSALFEQPGRRRRKWLLQVLEGQVCDVAEDVVDRGVTFFSHFAL